MDPLPPTEWLDRIWSFGIQDIDQNIDQGRYSPTILKKVLCPFLQDFVNLNVTQLLIG